MPRNPHHRAGRRRQARVETSRLARRQGHPHDLGYASISFCPGLALQCPEAVCAAAASPMTRHHPPAGLSLQARTARWVRATPRRPPAPLSPAAWMTSRLMDRQPLRCGSSTRYAATAPACYAVTMCDLCCDNESNRVRCACWRLVWQGTAECATKAVMEERWAPWVGPFRDFIAAA